MRYFIFLTVLFLLLSCGDASTGSSGTTGTEGNECVEKPEIPACADGEVYNTFFKRCVLPQCPEEYENCLEGCMITPRAQDDTGLFTVQYHCFFE